MKLSQLQRGEGWEEDGKRNVSQTVLKQNVVFTKTWNCLKMLCFIWIINWNILKYLWRTDIVFSLFKERIHFKVWFLNINNINFVEKTQLQSTWLNNDIKHWFIYKNTKNVDWRSWWTTSWTTSHLLKTPQILNSPTIVISEFLLNINCRKINCLLYKMLHNYFLIFSTFSWQSPIMINGLHVSFK